MRRRWSTAPTLARWWSVVVNSREQRLAIQDQGWRFKTSCFPEAQATTVPRDDLTNKMPTMLTDVLRGNPIHLPHSHQPDFASLSDLPDSHYKKTSRF
ncbi:hypothetical protein Bca101_024179 [Brassica carinata]